MPDEANPLAPSYLEVDVVECREGLRLAPVLEVLRKVQHDVLEAVVAPLEAELHRDVVQFYYWLFHYIISANPGSIFLKTILPRRNTAVHAARSGRKYCGCHPGT